MFDEANLPDGFPPPGPVGVVIVKKYPASRVAITSGEDQDQMFNPLFKHIKKHDIAMSAPVEITWSEPPTKVAQTQSAKKKPADTDDIHPTAMAFVYKDPAVGTAGPDGNVQVVDVPAQTYLSVGVRGSYNTEHLVQGVTQLRDWLAKHPEYKAVGPPRYLGYNSPFVPWFLRFGEVQLPILGA